MDEKTRADSLAVFLTGQAVADGDATIDIARIDTLGPPFIFAEQVAAEAQYEENSLGGPTSELRSERIALYITNHIKNIRIDRASAKCDEGIGTIEVTGTDSIRFTAPSGTAGLSTDILSGQTKLLEDGADSSKFIVVTRTNADELMGITTIHFLKIFNNAIGSSNVSGTEQAAGEEKIRCLALININETQNIDLLKVWIKTLGTQQVSDSAQLGGSGAGTIETTGDFDDWPESGYCRIETSGGTLREIVYYSSRTSTVLTVPAAGRALLGTTAAAGAASDKIYAVPGIKIAKEDPDGNGDFTAATNENDTAAVAALTWTTGITAATGLNIGTVALGGSKVGLWVWLSIPAGTTAQPGALNEVSLSYSVNSVAFTEVLEGEYRVADDTAEKYELFRGVDAEPDLTAAAWETFTTLPHTTAALDVSHKYYFVLRKKNKYNLVSQNTTSWSVELDDAGAVVEPSPDGPENVEIEPAAAGAGKVTAEYFYDTDDEYAATKWLIYFTDTGVDPNPAVDTPTVVTMKKVSGVARLLWTSGSADNGDTLKVIVRTRRTSGLVNYDSDNTDIHSCIASTLGPAQPAAKAFHGRTAGVVK